MGIKSHIQLTDDIADYLCDRAKAGDTAAELRYNHIQVPIKLAEEIDDDLLRATKYTIIAQVKQNIPVKTQCLTIYAKCYPSGIGKAFNAKEDG